RHAYHGRLQLLGAVRVANELRQGRFDAVELVEEVDVEVRAAVFAVGDRLQADFLLEAHHFPNRAILDLAQRGGIDAARGEFAPGIHQEGRAQEAADVVVACGELRGGGELRRGGCRGNRRGFFQS